jgi:hypothetical protein
MPRDRGQRILHALRRVPRDAAPGVRVDVHSASTPTVAPSVLHDKHPRLFCLRDLGDVLRGQSRLLADVVPGLLCGPKPPLGSPDPLWGLRAAPRPAPFRARTPSTPTRLASTRSPAALFGSLGAAPLGAAPRLSVLRHLRRTRLAAAASTRPSTTAAAIAATRGLASRVAAPARTAAALPSALPTASTPVALSRACVARVATSRATAALPSALPTAAAAVAAARRLASRVAAPARASSALPTAAAAIAATRRLASRVAAPARTSSALPTALPTASFPSHGWSSLSSGSGCAPVRPEQVAWASYGHQGA